jgi:ATP-dependent DNA helicase RecQ
METDHRRIEALLSSYNYVIARLVLFCIQELPQPLTVKRTIDVLKGNWNSFIQSNQLDQLRSFSVLPGYSRDQLSDIIDVLISHGMILVQKVTEDDEEFAVIIVGEAGLKYLDDKNGLNIDILDILLEREVATIPEDDLDLYYKLKIARRQLAEEYDYPTFMICADTTLQDICLKKPMEPHELRQIAGVDEPFMQEYSKQFLYVIRQYVTREKGS